MTIEYVIEGGRVIDASGLLVLPGGVDPHTHLAYDLGETATADDYARQVIATGFLAQAKRFGTIKLEDPHQIIEDVLNTTGQVVLGLSLRCARCHDHKFDPIASKDYYALYGVFASTRYPFPGGEETKRPKDFVTLPEGPDGPALLAAFASAFGPVAPRLHTWLVGGPQDMGTHPGRLWRLGSLADVEDSLSCASRGFGIGDRLYVSGTEPFLWSVATAAAIVSGEAPGRLAVTEMVGKSTLGNSETGSAR